MVVAFELLTESLSVRHLVAHGRLEEFLSACTCPYLPQLCHHGGVASLMTCRVCILRTSPSGWSFLFMIYANYGAIAVIVSTIYMTTVELFDEYPFPLLPWDDDDCHWSCHSTSILNDIIILLSMETNTTACCWGNRSWSRSIIINILLPFLTWWFET